MMKGMISQLAWQRQKRHNLPTRWSESQGEAELHCSPHFGTGRSGMGWRKGCLSIATAGGGPRLCSHIYLPALTISQGMATASSKHLSSVHLLSSMALREWQRDGAEQESRGYIAGEWSRNRRWFLWDPVGVPELCPQLLLTRSANIF